MIGGSIGSDSDGRAGGGAMQFSRIFSTIDAHAFRHTSGLDVATSAGWVTADVAFGGAFYALVDAAALGVEVLPANAATLTRLGMEIKRAVERELEVVHPEEPELRGVYGTI